MAKGKLKLSKRIVNIGGTSRGVIIPSDWFALLDVNPDKDKLDLEININTSCIKITKAK